MKKLYDVSDWAASICGYLTVYFLARLTGVDLEHTIQAVTLMLVFVLYVGRNDKREG